MKIPRVVLAGTTSGVGKTSITAAIIHGIRERGYSVQPFKVGPDFIDPSYLTSVAKKTARNLDSWLMGPKGVLKSLVQNSKADLSIIEGVMGYYDGFSGRSNFASTYHIASITRSPVILVLDASKTARSIAATAMGFSNFARKSGISGFILNKIGSKRHETFCKDALSRLKIPVLGVIPRDPHLHLESRHLGLIPVKEQKLLEKKINYIAKSISNFIDIDKIIEISKRSTSLPTVFPDKAMKKKTRIAVALDESFNFYYQDNLDALQRAGAELEFFSPISDTKIPTCDGIYIGGGFPEVKAQLLQRNKSMQQLIKKFAEGGFPIYAECGGLMYLTKSIHYHSKKSMMVGLFDAITTMEQKLKLSYTKAKTNYDCVIAGTSQTIRGHEFHFSKLDSLPKDSKYVYNLSVGAGIKDKKDGLSIYNTLASYMHVHFSNSSLPRNFVQTCIKNSRK